MEFWIFCWGSGGNRRSALRYYFQRRSNNTGTVFRLKRDGSGFSILYNFPAFSTNFRGSPLAGLIEASDGRLYGTTSNSVFSLNKDGEGFRILYGNLPSNDAQAGVIEASDGALYGTSFYGGTHFSDGFIFRLNRDGSDLTVLHNFRSITNDGMGLKTALLEASDRFLYGTTRGGGANGLGVVYRLRKDGFGYAVLHGGYSLGPFVEGADRALYGTRANAIFKLNKDGADYSVLHVFGQSPSDIGSLTAGLTKASDGMFYGTTANGGSPRLGTVFKMWPPQTPNMVTATSDSAAQVTLTGMDGYQYQILCSPDLKNWSVLTTVTMSPTGIYTYTDNNPPPQGAYYRAAWMP